MTSNTSQLPDAAETAAWHKRFAIDCNNRSWGLSVAARTPAEDKEMLDTAHAAAWHWGHVGDELNRMRATTLLAEVHALLGMGRSALAFAQEIRDYFGRAGVADWEMALVYTVYAHAAHAAGLTAEHREAHANAAAAIEAIADEEDRKVILATFAQVPAP